MKKYTFSFFFLIIFFYTKAQITYSCEVETDIALLEQKAHSKLFQQTRSGAANTYDLKYHRCEWAIDPAVNFINGIVTSYFKPTIASFNTMQFDLNNALTVDSVKYHNTPIAFSQPAGNLLELNFSTTLPVNILDSVSIFYKGAPANSGFGSFIKSDHWGTPIIWTLSEPFGAQDWWPCKQDLNDKIDSIDIIVTTPLGNRAASNGLLVSETTSGANKIYHWKSTYKIATYLIAIAVTNYVAYTDSLFIHNDTLEILNYVFPENLPTVIQETPETKKVIQLFDSLTIPYPFMNEKYGHAQFGWGGGMEHQTMSFMGGFNFGLVAHECAHQWFGDHITCGSWEDIWLNEGFATYFEGLCAERYFPNNWMNWKQGKINSITSAPDGSVKCTDTTSVSRIFNGRLSYNKGAYLLRMLRWKIGDAAFFNALKNYLNDPLLAGGYAKTPQLKAHFEAASGQNLTNFFNQWYYGEGYPSYEVIYNQNESNVILSINQFQSHPSVSFFDLPVALKFVGIGHDTTIVFNHQYSGQTFTATINFPIISIVVDPELYIISARNKSKNISTSTSLKDNITIYPNPVSTNINISFFFLSQQELVFEIYDVTGKKIISTADSFSIGYSLKSIDISQLSSGNYTLKIIGKGIDYSNQIIKQ